MRQAHEQRAQAGDDSIRGTQVGRHYRTYLELMRHWDAVLPGRVLRVRHEHVVDDLEGNVRRMLEFSGVEFEPAASSSTGPYGV